MTGEAINEYERQIVFDAIKAFKDHQTIFRTGLGGIDVLDFRRQNSAWYSLRVVFDHEYDCGKGRVYISGDLGEAVIYPTKQRSIFKILTSTTGSGSTIAANACRRG